MVITIESAALSQIYGASQQVVLARKVAMLVQSSGASRTRALPPVAVAWQVFAPLESNQIDWSATYGCFAAAAGLVAGTVLTPSANLLPPVAAGTAYALSAGSFSAAGPGLAGSYTLVNRMPGAALALGLTQTATINGTAVAAPLCAIPVLCNEAAFFTPGDVISVFLSSATSGGTVIPPLTNVFSVTAVGGQTGPTIGFGDQTNQFYQIS